MALLACHTLRHSFNATQHSRQQEQRLAAGLFTTSRQAEPSAASAQGWRLKAATQQTELQDTQAVSSARAGLAVEQLQDVVAANLPVFYFHPDEKSMCENSQMKRVLTVKDYTKHNAATCYCMQVLALLAKQGSLDGPQLELAQQAFDRRPIREQKRQFMLLQLDASARKGQPLPLKQIPIYAHIKEVMGPKGTREAVEINYMKFLAYNGSYKPFGWIPAGDLGAHDADWEHVTVRLSADAQQLLGAYYSAHRHRDGVWRSADELPLTQDKRIRAHIALDGHGSYPEAGFIPRVFFAFNDRTSDRGAEWRPDHVVIVTPSGPLPQVPSRGASLNGSSLPALGRHTSDNVSQSRHASDDVIHSRQASENATPHASDDAHSNGARSASGGYRPTVQLQASPWLAFKGRWGSSVEAPAMQEWFFRAENPVTRTWLQQVFLPLAPGIDVWLERGQEQVEEALDDFQSAVDDLQEAIDANVDKLKGNIEESSEDVRQRYHAAMDALMRADAKAKGERKHEEVFRRLKAALDAVSKQKDRDE